MRDNARIGGVLSIVAGGWGILWALGSILLISLVTLVPFDSLEPAPQGDLLFIALFFYLIFGGFFLITGALAIVGGIFALKKKHWGLALAGAIAGTIVLFPCGIPAIIFISLGKPEFAGQVVPVPAGNI
jgi:hypothetical protein